MNPTSILLGTNFLKYFFIKVCLYPMNKLISFQVYTGAPDAARFFLLADRDKQRLIN